MAMGAGAADNVPLEEDRYDGNFLVDLDDDDGDSDEEDEA